MVHPPGSGKDIVAKIVTYLRNNNGTAVLNGQVLAAEFDCDSSNVLWDIRRLKGCRIITAIDPHGSGHRNSRFSLAAEFMDGDKWRDVLQNHAPLIVHKKSVPGETKNNLAVKIVEYLRSRSGRSVINGTALAKEWGVSQPALSYALRSLIRKGLVATVGPTGQGVRNTEFFLTENGKTCVVSQPLLQDVRERKNGRKDTGMVSNDDIALKLSISRELVQVYEKLNEAQQLALQLQSDKDRLEARVKELEEELQSEKSSHNRDANDIATLELQLRELRQLTTKNARQAIFNHRGVQS